MANKKKTSPLHEAVDRVNAAAVEGAQPVTTINEVLALDSYLEPGSRPARGGVELDEEQQAVLDAAAADESDESAE